MDNFILIVEDTASLAAIYAECLHRQHYETKVVGTGTQALTILKEHQPLAVLLDLKLPDMPGMDILKTIRAQKSNSAVIVITGDTVLNTAVEAMQLGADDFITKPVDPDRLQVTIHNTIEKRKLQKIVDTLQEKSRSHFCGFIGKSPEMQAVYHMIENAARSRASVMIMGESGTGKEVAAQAVHDLSDRKDKNFIALNCAAIPHDLLESEIFGHIKGAFTGATMDREGAAKRANGGTLFLDELTEMPVALQSKLLRFIQEGTFSPVGSSEVIKTNIRFVCATNRNPFEAINRGILREDLYYRLAVIPIEMPPLRERGNDIVLLAEHFLRKAAQQENKSFFALSPDAREKLVTHRWPGNVRELENMIRHAVVMHSGDTLTTDMLAVMKTAHPAPAPVKAAIPAKEGIFVWNAENEIRPMKDVERAVIERALELCDGNITETARRLELNPATIHRKLKAWNGLEISA